MLYPPQNRCVKIGLGHVTWPLVTWPSFKCHVTSPRGHVTIQVWHGQTQQGIQKESWTKGCKDIWIHLLEFRTVLLIPTNKTLLIRLGSISIWHFRTYRPFTCQSSKSKLACLRVFTMTRVFSHLYVFRVYNDHSNNFTDSIFIGEVFQIEVSDVVDLVHPLEIMKKSTWRQLECLRENAFSVFHMRLKFQIINPMSL